MKVGSSDGGDVSLKGLPESYHHGGDDGLLSHSQDSDSSPQSWTPGKFSTVTPGATSQSPQPPTLSPSRVSLLSCDEAQFDELDEACTILNDMESRGVISIEEKQRRRALVISFMEFAAVDDDNDNDSGEHLHHSWGPAIELLRLAVVTSVGCYRSCCRFFLLDSSSDDNDERRL